MQWLPQFFHGDLLPWFFDAIFAFKFLLYFYHIKDCFKDNNILTYITYINIHFNPLTAFIFLAHEQDYKQVL